MIAAPWELTTKRPRSMSGVELEGDRPMKLIYVDESGTSIRETKTVVAGVIIDADSQWVRVQKHINGLIEKYVLEEDREGFVFHATDLFEGRGKVFGNREKYPLARSREALKELLATPAKFRLPVVFGVSPKRPLPESPTRRIRRINASRDQAKAFAMCVIAAEVYMRNNDRRDEIALLFAENNTETQGLVEIMHQILKGRGKTKSDLALRSLFSEICPGLLPIRKIVDHVSFPKKRDAFFLQLADACSLVIRYFCEGRGDVRELFDALTQNKPERLNIGEGNASGYSAIIF